MALRRQPVPTPTLRVQQPQIQQQQQVQPAVINTVFRSPEEINIPLQQRRPNLSLYQPTTARYESSEQEEEEY